MNRKKQILQYGIISTVLLLVIAMSPGARELMTQSKYSGNWVGALEVGSMKLRLVIRVTSVNDTLKIMLDSPDQGAKDIPTANIYTTDDSLIFDVPAANARMEAKLLPNGRSLSARWNQGPARLSLMMSKTDTLAIEEPKRPQTPKPPFPYTSEEVKYINTTGNITLAGTLAIPSGPGPFPAVVLITGSGSQNRDEEIFGHKPFFVISDYLTRHGIAVLRVDDRGVGGSSGKNWEATSQDFAGDVLTGVDYLKTRKEIDKKHIGLIGHSEGGIIAPIAAVRSKDVAFIIMMAGTGFTGEEIIYMQSALMSRAEGEKEEVIAVQRTLSQIVFRNVKKNLDSAQTADAIGKEASALIESMPDTMKAGYTSAVAGVLKGMNAMLNPWFRYFLTYDPKPTLKKVQCPVLVLNGGKDLQVPPAENLPAIEASLKAGGNSGCTVKEFPGLNHLFQHCETGSPLEYMKIEETISPEVLQYMGDWIQKTAR